MAQGPEQVSPDDAPFEAFDANQYYDSIQGLVSVGAPDRDVPAIFAPPPYRRQVVQEEIPASSALEMPSTERLRFPELAQKEASRLYEAGLIYNFKKEYAKAVEFLEKAYRLNLELKHYTPALQALIELAWLKFCHEKKDGKAKSTRLFGEALRMINTHVHQPGITECRAKLLHYQGLVQYREKHYGEAMKSLMRAKTFCPPDSLEAARILDSQAVHYEHTNDYNRAIQCIQSALEIKKREGISYEEAVSNQILGRIYILKEEYEKALSCLSSALEIAEDLNDFKRIANLKNDIIRIRIYQGDVKNAARLIQEVIQDCQSQDLRVPFGMALFYQSYMLFADNQVSECRRILERDVLPIFKRFEYKKGHGMALRLMACVESHYGNDTRAIEMMSEVISVFKEENRADELAKTYFELGKLYLRLEEKKLALASMLEAMHIAELNDLTFLTSYIEDELFKLDEEKWQEVVDKRANYERVFERQPSLEQSLNQLSHSEGAEAAASEPNQSLVALLKIAQAMAGVRDLDQLLQIIKIETEQALIADRCTVFLYDRDANELWSKVASGLETEEIRFPAHLGLAGYVAKTGEILNIKNAYEDPRFNADIDKKTGYRTENILCIPMRNRRLEIIGVFQVLNKQNGSFGKTDEDLLNAIASNAGVAIENASLATEMKISFDSFVKTLSSTIDARDPITAGHSERVAAYSTLIGEEMNMPEPDLEALKYASLLHDIGKIGIREDILKKDGRLTEKEYRHIQKHVYYTHEILKNVHFEHHLRMVPEIAASHHEKIDGTGYHRGLQGDEILLSGRILALCDVFDAITSRRHYRNRMPFERVLQIILKDVDAHFDKDCVDSFLNVKLNDVSRVLLMEREAEYDEGGLLLLKKLDKHITIGEYQRLCKRDSLSKGEAETHRIFSNLYHRREVGDLD
ncbi:MAG: HD domain-containing phosphohydrolase [Vampirovibrionales bacterium]|nr:HD domain-containing phosphohydrolase [Vampirovibrionales bacterium]